MNKLSCYKKIIITACAIGLVFALSSCTSRDDSVQVSYDTSSFSSDTVTSAENLISSAINQTVVSNAEQSGVNADNFFPSDKEENGSVNASSQSESDLSSQTSSVSSMSSETSSKDFSLENSEAWNSAGSLKPVY